MLTMPQIDLSDMLTGFILNRLFFNYKIEAGDVVNADPSVLAGDDFITFFNYLEAEANNLSDVEHYQGNPLFICLSDYVKAKLRQELATATVVKETEEVNEVTVISKLFPSETQSITVPDDVLDTLTNQVVIFMLTNIRSKNIHLGTLYESYLMLASRLLDTMPNARKLDKLYLTVCCQWSDKTNAMYLSYVDVADEKNAFEAMNLIVNKFTKELTEELVHGAVSIATKGKKAGKVSAYSQVTKEAVAPIFDFLDNYEKQQPGLKHVIAVVKGLLSAQIKM